PRVQEPVQLQTPDAPHRRRTQPMTPHRNWEEPHCWRSGCRSPCGEVTPPEPSEGPAPAPCGEARSSTWATRLLDIAEQGGAHILPPALRLAGHARLQDRMPPVAHHPPVVEQG